MCRDKKPQQEEQEGTPVEDEPSNNSDGGNDSEPCNSSDDTPVRRRTREHTGHKLSTTNEHHDGSWDWGGGGMRGPQVGGRTTLEGAQNRRPKAVGALSTKPTAQGRGSSTTERRMEDYYTRTPRKKAKDEDESYNATGQQPSSNGGRQLRWRYPEANH
jgi:hypothetical protein